MDIFFRIQKKKRNETNEIKVFNFSNNAVLRHEFIQHNLLKV